LGEGGRCPLATARQASLLSATEARLGEPAEALIAQQAKAAAPKLRSNEGGPGRELRI